MTSHRNGDGVIHDLLALGLESEPEVPVQEPAEALADVVERASRLRRASRVPVGTAGGDVVTGSVRMRLDSKPRQASLELPASDAHGPPAPAGTPRHRLAVVLAAVLVLVSVATPAIAVLVSRQSVDSGTAVRPSGPQAQPGGPPTPLVTAAMGPQACVARPDEKPVPTAVPLLPGELGLFPGRVYHRDPTGFRIATFSGWALSRVGSLVCFREPRGRRVLAIDQQQRKVTDPVVESVHLEATWLAAAGLADYARISLKAKPFTGGSAAELEYTYLDQSGDRMRGINLYLATPRRLYTIYWLAADADWPAQLDNYRNLTIAFVPAS